MLILGIKLIKMDSFKLISGCFKGNFKMLGGIPKGLRKDPPVISCRSNKLLMRIRSSGEEFKNLLMLTEKLVILNTLLELSVLKFKDSMMS